MCWAQAPSVAGLRPQVLEWPESQANGPNLHPSIKKHSLLSKTLPVELARDATEPLPNLRMEVTWEKFEWVRVVSAFP